MLTYIAPVSAIVEPEYTDPVVVYMEDEIMVTMKESIFGDIIVEQYVFNMLTQRNTLLHSSTDEVIIEDFSGNARSSNVTTIVSLSDFGNIIPYTTYPGVGGIAKRGEITYNGSVNGASATYSLETTCTVVSQVRSEYELNGYAGTVATLIGLLIRAFG